MDWTSNVTVHQSAWPEVARARIGNALRRGELDPALLYSGLGQSLRWVAVHEAYSPAKSDPGCAAIHDAAFRRVGEQAKGNVIHVVSLACGDGSKDTRCLELLRESDRAVIYTPVDISPEMVLTAERSATRALPGLQITPLVCDLPNCSVLPGILKSFDPSGAERVILFLGTIHNYWPPDILRSLIYPLRSQDRLLIGANLAPVNDYDHAVERIRGQYDNPATRDWMMGALRELNISAEDGALEFSVQSAESMPALKRIQADFTFQRDTRIPFFGESIEFRAGEKLRVFFSYRFTPEQIRAFLEKSRLEVAAEWIADSGEEGLFRCQRGGLIRTDSELPAPP